MANLPEHLRGFSAVPGPTRGTLMVWNVYHQPHAAAAGALTVRSGFKAPCNIRMQRGEVYAGNLPATAAATLVANNAAAYGAGGGTDLFTSVDLTAVDGTTPWVIAPSGGDDVWDAREVTADTCVRIVRTIDAAGGVPSGSMLNLWFTLEGDIHSGDPASL